MAPPLQASFKNAMSKPVLDLASRAKHTYIGELKTSAGSVGALPQGLCKVGSKFDVLPAITGVSSQHGRVRSVVLGM